MRDSGEQISTLRSMLEEQLESPKGKLRLKRLRLFHEEYLLWADLSKRDLDGEVTRLDLKVEKDLECEGDLVEPKEDPEVPEPSKKGGGREFSSASVGLRRRGIAFHNRTYRVTVSEPRLFPIHILSCKKISYLAGWTEEDK